MVCQQLQVGRQGFVQLGIGLCSLLIPVVLHTSLAEQRGSEGCQAAILLAQNL